MEPSPHRRPILSDLAALIVAVALGIAMTSSPFGLMSGSLIDSRRSNAVIFVYKLTIAYSLIVPATILIALWAPRRSGLRLREAIKSPGIAACVAASTAFLLLGLEAVPDLLHGTTYNVGPIHPSVVGSQRAGYAVIGAWVVVGLRRPIDGVIPWLDRIGLVLGALWAFASALGVVTHLAIRWDYVASALFPL